MQSAQPAHQTPTGIAGFDTEFLSRRSTKVLIQEIATRRYLSSNGLWTSELAQALTFRSGSAAMEHLTQRKLTNVHLILTRDISFREVIPLANLLHS